MGACAIDLVNEESALYNPGGVGLFHLDKTIAVAWPQSTKWLPALTDDLRLKSYTLSAGMSSQRLHWGKDPLLNVSLAFAFSRLELDYSSGEPMIHGRDRADCYTIAIGADCLIRVGIGYTYKRITERATSSYFPYNYNLVANGEDVGITMEFPLWKMWHLKHPQKVHGPPPAMQITPRYTFVVANSAQHGGALPQRQHEGLSLHATYVRTGCSIIDMTLVGEAENSHLSERKLLKSGVELGLLEVCYLRLGKLKDDPPESHGTDVNTLGLGFSLNGLIKYTRIIEHLHPSTQLRWLLTNLDVRFDYARYGGDEDQTFYYNTKFYKLTVSL